jgi:putative FmdB family regulatory protein
MPTYDYRCTLCGREVEVSHAIGAPGPESCMACGGPMKKALSTPAIHFKGSGWAKKDARSAASSTTKAGGESASSGGADDGGTGSTEAGSGPSAPATSSDTAATKDPTAATSGKKADSSAKAS